MIDHVLRDAFERLGYHEPVRPPYNHTRGDSERTPCKKCREQRESSTQPEEWLRSLQRTEAVEVFVFPQTWGSTALGHGGIGGQTITSDHTVVVTRNRMSRGGDALVYFGGRYAYTCKTTAGFHECLNGRRMPGKWQLEQVG